MTSGGIICSSTIALAGGGPDEWLTTLPAWVNGSVTRITHADGAGTVLESNDSSHLPDELVTTR